MSFYNELERRGLTQIVNGTPFKKVLPKGAREFRDAIVDIVQNNRSVYLDEDCDIDGYLAVLTLKTMFDVLGHTNYYIPTHVYKRHGIGAEAIDILMRDKKFDYYIITDSSTNDTELFDLFLKHPETKCICIDHHMPNINRDVYADSNILLINPKLDSQEKGEKTLLFDLSACAVISLLVDMTVKSAFVDKYDNLRGAHWIYGYITLYSDSCNFSLYNIAYVRMVLQSHFPLPPLVEMFTNQYTVFGRQFVQWTFAPRVNALLRAEYFTNAYNLFYNIEQIDRAKTREYIEQVYQESKQFVAELCTQTSIVEKDNFVIGILPMVARARNYTGLVASSITTKYNKPAMILLRTTGSVYEGSVRDCYSRNLLSIFKTVIEADGHNPAFGVKVPVDKLNDISYVLDSLLVDIEVSDSAIVVDWSMYSSKDRALYDDIILMSEYNEYSGSNIPLAYAKLPIRSNMVIKRYPKYTKIRWGSSIEMTVFDRYISEGDIAIVSPNYPNQLYVVNIQYKYK